MAKDAITVVGLVVRQGKVDTTIPATQDKTTKNTTRFKLDKNSLGIDGSVYVPKS